jgi:hypothetical protein
MGQTDQEWERDFINACDNAIKASRERQKRKMTKGRRNENGVYERGGVTMADPGETFEEAVKREAEVAKRKGEIMKDCMGFLILRSLKS